MKLINWHLQCLSTESTHSSRIQFIIIIGHDIDSLKETQTKTVINQNIVLLATTQFLHELVIIICLPPTQHLLVQFSTVQCPIWFGNCIIIILFFFSWFSFVFCLKHHLNISYFSRLFSVQNLQWIKIDHLKTRVRSLVPAKWIIQFQICNMQFVIECKNGCIWLCLFCMCCDYRPQLIDTVVLKACCCHCWLILVENGGTLLELLSAYSFLFFGATPIFLFLSNFIVKLIGEQLLLDFSLEEIFGATNTNFFHIDFGQTGQCAETRFQIQIAGFCFSVGFIVMQSANFLVGCQVDRTSRAWTSGEKETESKKKETNEKQKRNEIRIWLLI